MHRDSGRIAGMGEFPHFPGPAIVRLP